MSDLTFYLEKRSILPKFKKSEAKIIQYQNNKIHILAMIKGYSIIVADNAYNKNISFENVS